MGRDSNSDLSYCSDLRRTVRTVQNDMRWMITSMQEAEDAYRYTCIYSIHNWEWREKETIAVCIQHPTVASAEKDERKIIILQWNRNRWASTTATLTTQTTLTRNKAFEIYIFAEYVVIVWEFESVNVCECRRWCLYITYNVLISSR